MRSISFLLMALAVAATLHPAPSEACSCAAPQPMLLSPRDETPAPLDAILRISMSPNEPGDLVLRARGGAAVPFRASRRTLGWVSQIELVPTAALAPDTRYELALVRKDQRPSTYVFATFATGTERDDAAPKLGAPHAAVAVEQVREGMCSSAGRAIEVGVRPASDPGRPAAHLLYGVWLPDAQGKLDTSAAPSFFDGAWEGTIRFGTIDLCDPLKVELPSGPHKTTFAVAAFDEAGNRSDVHTVTVDFARPRRQ